MRPVDRSGFTTAIICALHLEADAVKALFDEEYDTHGQYYKKQDGDLNVYVNGRIGDHNVVLCYLPDMGKASAAAVVSNLRVSYLEIKLVLVVGICGGFPSLENQPIFLGDVVISDSLIEYDFGSQYPGEFEQKKTRRTANREALTLLSSLRGGDTRVVFQNQLSTHLAKIQQSHERWRIPDSSPDVVYEPSYYHKHHGPIAASCACSNGDSICKGVLRMDCRSLGCEESSIRRKRSSTEAAKVYIGPMASADTVMKSGLHRDNLAKKDGIIGFEMEGAGVWDGMSTCLIVKGVCDYADSHKDKNWQDYAAATGASAAKTLLVHYWKPMNKGRKYHWMVPFNRNPDFSGRQKEIEELERLISLPHGPKKLAISGLGGIGKTQVALELAYQLRESDDEYPVLWIACTGVESIEQSYINITRILGMDDASPAEAKNYVKAYLSNELTKWLLVLDNVDDSKVWKFLKDILPQSMEGHILVTTRNRQVAVEIAASRVVPIVEPDKESATVILQNKLVDKSLLKDKNTTTALLEQLAYLPLAIAQAASYMNGNPGITLADYVELLGQQESEVIEVLSTNFTDEGRYNNIRNPVAATWLVSFHQIRKLNPSAVDYLTLMACVNHHDIPQAFLPPLATVKEKFDAIGLLTAFDFMTIHRDTKALSWHPLVHLATRNWIRQNQQFARYLSRAANRLEEAYPHISEGDRRLRRRYLPHAMTLIGEKEFQQMEHTGLLFKIAHGLYIDDRYHEAQRLFTKVLEIQQEQYKDQDPSAIVNMSYLASTYLKLNQTEKAEEIAAPALAASKEVLGVGASNTIFITSVLAAVYKDLGRWAKVNELDLQMIRALRQTEGLNNDYPQVWKYMSTIGDSYKLKEKVLEAEDLYLSILELQEKALGSSHPDTLASMTSLASLYRSQARWEEAKQMLADIIKACNRGPEYQPRVVITTEIELAGIHMDLRELKQAEELLSRALEAATEVLGPHSAVTLTAISKLPWIYRRQGRFQEAEELATRAVKVATEVFGPQNPNTLTEMINLASIYETQERFREAESLLLQVLGALNEKLDSDQIRITSTMMQLAQIYWRQGRKDDGDEMKEKATKIRTRENVLGPKHPEVIRKMFSLATSYSDCGANEYARKLMARAVELANEALGPDDARTKEYTSFLFELQEETRMSAATVVPESSTLERGRRRDKLIPKPLLKFIRGSSRGNST